MQTTIVGNISIVKDGVSIVQGEGTYVIEDYVAAPPPPPPAPSSPDYETQYWHNQCAMLDPAAFVHVMGSNFSITVPEGEEWFLYNAWQAKVGNLNYFLREPKPLHMPSGFSLQGNGTTNAFVYYCRPSLVTYADPKAKYFERLARLKTLPQYVIGNTGGYSAFPSDFEKGLILASDAFDTAWTITASASAGLSNLMNEVSDVDPIRFAAPFTMPFNRAQMPGIMVKNVGLPSGIGSVTYRKLPLDW